MGKKRMSNNKHIVVDGIANCLTCLSCGEMMPLNLPKSLTEIVIDAEIFKGKHENCEKVVDNVTTQNKLPEGLAKEQLIKLAGLE